MKLRALPLLLLALTLACGGDHDAGDAGDGSDVETATADGESTSDDDASTGDDESLPPGVKPCVVDLDCGPAGSSCAFPNGCDASGQCVPEKALGECAQNPAPLVPEPDGRRCAPEGSGLDPCPEGAECFYWDGQCGAGKWGVCRANITICELLPPEMFEADSWCEPPMLLPNGKITCESPRY